MVSSAKNAPNVSRYTSWIVGVLPPVNDWWYSSSAAIPTVITNERINRFVMINAPIAKAPKETMCAPLRIRNSMK